MYHSAFVNRLIEKMYQEGLLEHLDVIKERQRFWQLPIPQLIHRVLKLERYERKAVRFIGCSHEQLLIMQKEQNVDYLPEIYQEFMLAMGENAGTLFVADVSYECGSAGSNKEIAIEILADIDNAPQLPEDAFVFTMLEAYGFDFFLTRDRVNDPAVFRYNIPASKFEEKSDTLSNYLYNLVEIRAKEFKGLK